MTTQEDVTKAAGAAMEMIDKLNNERFLKMNQISNLFVLTTFYHVGGNVADSCKPDQRVAFKNKDPRFICESKDSEENEKYLYFLDFVLKYRLWEKVPVYDPDKKEFYPHSFNGIINWLIASLDNSDGKAEFRSDSQKDEWSYILASLYYFDKLDAFKTLAIEVYDFTREKIEQICALPDTGKMIADSILFEAGVDAIKERVGLSRNQAIKDHVGVFITEASYCSETLKNEYLTIKGEYEKALEDIKLILAQSAQLTLCWNSASIGDTNVSDSMGINAYHDVTQVLNCCGEELKTDINNMTNGEVHKLITEGDEKTKSTVLNVVEELKAEGEKTLNHIKWTVIGVIVAVFLCFIMVMILFSRGNSGGFVRPMMVMGC